MKCKMKREPSKVRLMGCPIHTCNNLVGTVTDVVPDSRRLGTGSGLSKLADHTIRVYIYMISGYINTYLQ